jgi:hypothetical protein
MYSTEQIAKIQGTHQHGHTPTFAIVPWHQPILLVRMLCHSWSSFIFCNHHYSHNIHSFAPDAFSPPIKHQHLKDLSRKSTFEKISQRFHLNFQFFLTNYFLIFIGIGVVVLCLNFQCLIYGGLVYGLWVGHDTLKGMF